MTLKEARKEAIARKRRYLFLTISKQSEIGWYVEDQPTQRTVFVIHKNGDLMLYNSDFARNFQKSSLPKVRLAK